MKNNNKIDLNSIDFDRLKDQTSENPGLLPYAHTVGGALVKPEDKGKIKGRAVAAMQEQTERQLRQLYEQMQTLAMQAGAIQKRVEISEKIYRAQMGFEPLIGHIYYLYSRQDGQDVLSMIAPDEWGRSSPYAGFEANVKLLSDHTWEVLT